ncbi:hypothetical protein CTRI78_v001099 [Colletotrichum trifolii]|uniref:Uncharacterized protein n=1 Tax=Colletotrichum trifolii TaxID=5466 RepID=A0A4R8RQZ8_COLTR|nr:hypothetical protein CTRI78_v001099 [Colletotrichum trifolii]
MATSPSRSYAWATCTSSRRLRPHCRHWTTSCPPTSWPCSTPASTTSRGNQLQSETWASTSSRRWRGATFSPASPYEVVHRVIRKSPKTWRTHLPARIQSAPAVPTTTRTETEDLVALPHSTHHSLEEMLYAARGFLVAGGSSRQPLRAYCEASYTYVQEDYNEALAESRSHLDSGGVNPDELGDSGGPRNWGVGRSQTGKVVGTATGQV